MQRQAIRHDGLERMIQAYQFFMAVARRFRDACGLNRESIAPAEQRRSATVS